jgi:ATP-dependent RNA helicase RhlE
MAGFAALDLPDALVEVLGALGFSVPLPVQSEAIPAALAGRDVVVSAETGSGKTLAYLIPVVAALLDAPGVGRPRALVLTPTRELAAQVADVADALLAPLGLDAARLTGGEPVRIQAKALAAGCDVIVATPGRLLDLARRGHLDPAAIRTVVLDEADRMLDLGFLPHVQRCLALVPPPRRTLLFSATIPAPIEDLAAELLDDPVRVQAAEESDRPIPPGIHHVGAIVRAPLKRLLLAHLLREDTIRTALVFTSSRFRCGALARWLTDEGVPADSLHAGRKQEDRDATMAAFRAGELRVLVATDLAERGLDLPHLSHVVIFDLPKRPETYAHRVGRTARAFGEGTAITLAADPERKHLQKLASRVGVDVAMKTFEGFDYDQPPPPGLDPLVPQDARGRRDDAAEEDRDARPRWKRGSPQRQKAAFWDRARKARKKPTPRNPNPAKRRRKR